MNLDEALEESGVIAIIRGVAPGEVLAVAGALYEAGVRVVETPLNSPEPLQSIRLLAHEYRGRMTIGAGTVLTEAEVEEVTSVGGRLIVSPNTNPNVIRRAVALGAIPMPGVGTATEALAAVEAGARRLKLFPASTYGPAHLKAIRAVLPSDVIVAPVGGVGPGDMAAWRKAGAACFGIGSELYKPGMAVEEIGRRAAELVRAEKASRQPS